MPQFLRLALIDALTFDPKTGKGGPAANFKISSFKKQSFNKGLTSTYKTIAQFQGDHGNHITAMLSLADIIQLGGAAAVEYCGGPLIELKVGRNDISDEHNVASGTNLPHVDMNAEEIRSIYKGYDLTDAEIVALFGYRTLGFLSNNNETNKEERWTRNPFVFDNNYFVELLDANSPYLKTDSDKALINVIDLFKFLKDDGFRGWVEKYARDQEQFFNHFSKVYEKVSELGNKNLLKE